MKTLLALLRREVQEHRGSFIYLPMILTAFLIVIMLSGMTLSGTGTGESFSVQMDKQVRDIHSQNSENIAIQPFDTVGHLAAMSSPQRAAVIDKAFMGISAPLLIALWIVAFIYPLSALYGERKDRSILFWKSMPVSDAMTVVSKLVSAAIVLPLIYLGCIMVVQIAALVVTSVSAWQQSLDIWGTLWVPAHLVNHWLNYAGYLALASIWFLPMFGWLLLVSAFAKSVPAAWALLVPFGLRIVEQLFTPYHRVSDWLSHYGWPLGLWDGQALHAEGSLHLMINTEMLVSLAITLVMLVGAVYLRRRTAEI